MAMFMFSRNLALVAIQNMAIELYYQNMNTWVLKELHPY